MKAKDIVKFIEPANEVEKESLMVVIEMRENRVLVTDLRFSHWNIPPTHVYPANNLVVLTDLIEHKVENSLNKI